MKFLSILFFCFFLPLLSLPTMAGKISQKPGKKEIFSGEGGIRIEKSKRNRVEVSGAKRVSEKKKPLNLCCHMCRVSINHYRKNIPIYYYCENCANAYCKTCIAIRELSLQEIEAGDCPICSNNCCCIFEDCFQSHGEEGHCFTYKRKLQRHKAAKLKWKKYRIEDTRKCESSPGKKRALDEGNSHINEEGAKEADGDIFNEAPSQDPSNSRGDYYGDTPTFQFNNIEPKEVMVNRYSNYRFQKLEKFKPVQVEPFQFSSCSENRPRIALDLVFECLEPKVIVPGFRPRFPYWYQYANNLAPDGAAFIYWSLLTRISSSN